MSSIQNSKNHIRIPALVGLSIAAGILAGATMFGDQRSGGIIRGQSKFREILTLVTQDYVDTVNTDQLVEAAIEGMLHELDPHTSYIPAREVQLANTQLEGNFDGIGIEFYIVEDTINVVTPLSGGPSEEAGLRAGDKIVRVDGKNVAGTDITNRDVFDLLRGERGSKVNLTINRRGTPGTLDFTITRDKIPAHSVDISYMLDEQTGYIKVSRFAASTYREFSEALGSLRKQQMKRLILDLRDNPGGYMDRATKIADELLEGNKMIVYTDGRGTKFDQKTYAYRPGDFEQGPVIVLINEGSASASEIVAGALQDNDRALIVGRRSFGKGLVQIPINLSDDSELRLTISRYYTPSGRSIQKPYTDEDSYERDLLERYEHGEFFNADSIKFNDSLRYRTIGGRTVYGGGGIMPDYFVPADTSRGSKYLSQLYSSNVIREYAIAYYNDHQRRLEGMTFADFQRSFQVTDAMLEALVAAGERKDIPFKAAQFERSRSTIENSLKAFIAKSVWGNDGFFPVIHQNDDIFQQALNLFDRAELLAEGQFRRN